MCAAAFVSAKQASLAWTNRRLRICDRERAGWRLEIRPCLPPSFERTSRAYGTRCWVEVRAWKGSGREGERDGKIRSGGFFARLGIECKHALVGNVNARNNEDGSTPLHYAAWTGHVPVIQLLLTVNTIELETKNHEGNTPLHVAAAYSHLHAVKLLLAAGEFPHSAYIENNDKKKPFEYATNSNVRQYLSSTTAFDLIVVIC